MSEELGFIPDKDEIKARLPLAFACSRLGIALNSEFRASCPFHSPDEEPSFYLWEGDDGRTRWHCQPCGIGGDVFDLISRLHHCSFPEAIERAAALLSDLPPDYSYVAPPAQRPFTSREEMEKRVNSARERAALPEQHGILAVRLGFADVSQPALCEKWDEFLRSYWGWGITELGEVLMPHWSVEGVLTGCKVRHPDGEKGSIVGSIYSGQLYGAWLGRRHQDVLLTEGETDCVYAAWAAIDENIGLDVYSLPAGAGDDVEEAWVKFIRNSRTIYIAFDPDTAGVKATWKWIAALQKAGHRNVRICCLPLNRDLRDAKPTIRHLLATARMPLEEPVEIREEPGGYVRPGKEGLDRPVTNWTIEPVARLAGGEEPGFDVVLSYRGVRTKTILRLSDLATSREIKRWCNKHGLVFTGRDDDLQRIAEYVVWKGSIVPEIYQTDQVGLQEPPEAYKFAGPTVVFPQGYVGKTPWRYVPSYRAADVTDRVFLPAAGKFEWRWLRAFLALSATDVTHPLLAWVVASARRPEAPQFPLMFLGGSSGSGKSTLARLAARLAGSGIEIDLGNMTPYILTRAIASTTSLPVFIDEWTRMSRKDTREALQGNIPVLYAGGNAEKGQADLSSAVYKLTAPVIIAGEDSFMLDREIERMVAVNPRKKAQNKEALAFVADKPLERFGQLLHSWLATQPDLPGFPRTFPTRTGYNQEVVRVGWETLKLLLEHAARFEEVPDIPEHPDLTCFEQVLDRAEENVYDQALLVGQAMRDQDGHPVVWADPEGKGTWARFQTLTGLLQSRNVDISLPGGSRSMKGYFEEQYGKLVLGSAVRPPEGFTALRAWLIPGHQLPEAENPYAGFSVADG